MKISIPRIATLSALAAVIFSASASAQTDSMLEYRLQNDFDPDQYFFFEDDEVKQVTSYNNERIVRVCVGDGEVVTPMTVRYDDKTATVEPGDCMRVEAMEVSLEPAENLEPNSYLRVEVQTLN